MIASLSRYRNRRLGLPLALIGLGILACSLLFFAGGAAHGQAAQVSTDPADISAGQSLYEAHCQSCHGYQGEGGVPGAPVLVNVGAAAADFYLTTGRMPLNNPANQALRHHPFFDEQQIRQLDSYIAALPVITGIGQPGPGIPTVEPLCPTSTEQAGCVTLSEGQRLFAIDCAQCHQAAGSGGMLSKGNVVPGVHNANITQASEAMRIGPMPMPIFGANQLSDHQVSAIAHYVQYLHQPANPGGLGITHFGPVAEGFVGILAGFCVLWFAARMIGTRG
ncbi:MAG TPA: c-type cytochrome [Acidimicrobiales bacterium]|nr:c-type cytochrome [Acidimicrobiales bacterium]